MNKKDLILTAAILIIGILGIFIQKTGVDESAYVVITKNGEVYSKVPLFKDCEIDVEGENTIVIKDGKAYMQYASCPDKLCVHMGKTGDSSKKIICLPNKVTVEVTKKSSLDTVVR